MVMRKGITLKPVRYGNDRLDFDDVMVLYQEV